jgi:hypothetical protein
MIDVDVLKKRGLTIERLKQIFIAPKEPVYSNDDPAFPGGEITDPSSDIARYPKNPTDGQIRQFFENRIRARLDEGMERNFDSFKSYAAVDLALDTPFISKLQLPLQMLGQGFIDVESCYQRALDVSPEIANQIFDKDERGRVLKVNTPKFWEISHNLVLSLLNRRVAAIATPIAQQHPFMLYDSRDTSLAGELKADLMTQRAEIMADDYGYRHDIVQTVRDVSAYTHQVEFIRSAWEKEEQILMEPEFDDEVSTLDPEKRPMREVKKIIKEGLCFVAPHPSRVFWDHAYPLAKLNNDTGPYYVGFWDIVRVGELRQSPEYWNRDAIEFNQSVYDFLTANGEYFTLYYRDRIALPSKNPGTPSLRNDRLTNVGFFAEGTDDVSTTISHYYEKLNPKEFGIANYDHDVWIHFVVGGNSTVIYAEPLACAPGVVYHYNENDQRDISSSFAMQVIPYQDQVNNLLSQLLEVQYQGLMKFFAMNTDNMTASDITEVENSIKNRDYSAAKSLVIKYSKSVMEDMGIDHRSQYADRLRVIEVSTSEKTGEIIRSIVQIISLAERNLFFSPAELGQVAPREVSATEVNIVNNTTLGIRDFHGLGVFEGLDAKKRLIYEASIAFGSDEIELPVMRTYSTQTIIDAGFNVVGADREGRPETIKRGRFTVSGSKRDLIHNYIFSSRDGTEREVSNAIAAATVQVFDVIGRYPTLQKFLTNEDASNMLNAITRRLGLSFRARMPDGVDPLSPLAEGTGEQVVSAIQQLAQIVSQQQEAIKSISSAVQEIVGGIPTRRGEVSPGVGRGAPPLSPEPPQPQAVGLGFE